ncbi:MAG TPA: FHA domain-containing protein, partial [Pirellulaceae bacterium]|nr:FHA domain-containing protein [Pirellulaceae bacterium]
LRPSMAIIKVIFDGSPSQGQEIPVFQDEFFIGREDADLVIAHDALISKRHARLYRTQTTVGAPWVLEDLQSTNGTFASVDQGILRHGQEILLGSRRYRFELPDNSSPQLPQATDRKQTSLWRPPAANETSLPSLVEIDLGQDGKRHGLTDKEVKIGSDAGSCLLAVTEDAFLSAQHARIRQDKRGRWIIEPINALNGVWARIRSIQIAKSGLFQVGEQRISIRVP